MNQLQSYFDRYYLTTPAVAAALGISEARCDELVTQGLFPAPSYVVSTQRLRSVVFGEFDTPGLADAQYFHRDMLAWMRHALGLLESCDLDTARDKLEQTFRHDFGAALQELHHTCWPLPDAFDAQACVIEAGLAARCEKNWTYFQAGIFGLCVAHPVSAATIAEKEILQEKLIAISHNGTRTEYEESEIALLLETIEHYEKAAMPFTTLEFPRSSRYRLVDQLRETLPQSSRPIKT